MPSQYKRQSLHALALTLRKKRRLCAAEYATQPIVADDLAGAGIQPMQSGEPLYIEHR